MALTAKTHLSVLAQKISLTWTLKLSLLLWQFQIVDDKIQVVLSRQVLFIGRMGSCKCWITIHIFVSLAYIFITWLTVTQRKVWVIEKLWKCIWIQRPKIHQKQTFFLMGQNLCWPLLCELLLAGQDRLLSWDN
jgi:hypothetical protein